MSNVPSIQRPRPELVKRQADLVERVAALPPGKARITLENELEDIRRTLAALGYRALPS